MTPRARRDSHALALSDVLLTLSIRDVLPATPRARVVRLDLSGTAFAYVAGQAVLVGSVGGFETRRTRLAAPPEEARQTVASSCSSASTRTVRPGRI